MKKTTWFTCSKHGMRYPKGGECSMCKEEASGGRGFYQFVAFIIVGMNVYGLFL